MSKNYFITGTDTDAGKTLITEALLMKANQNGLRTVGLKPLAAGAELVEGELQNSDAQRLQKAASVKLSYSQVNPVVLKDAIAPHIAAQQEGRNITASRVVGFIRGTLMQPADLRLIEGAGGWLVPLNPRELFNAVAKELQLDVILVVGMKLGCINHALLTARAIMQDGLRIAGWVGTQIDSDMPVFDENVETLTKMLPAPCLGVVPYQAGITAEMAAQFLQLPES